MKNRFFFAFLFLFLCDYAGAQGTKTANSDRVYAELYLALASDCLLKGAWDAAVSYADTGLQYDSGISDLWYVKAAAIEKFAQPVHNVLPLVEWAYNTNRWIGGNKDSARIFFADMLYITGRPSRAVEVLDSYPALVSADAAFIRAKSYYKTNTPLSVNLARAEIEAAREIYPDDERFLLTFFKNELSKTDYRTGQFERDAVAHNVRAVIDSGTEDAELTIYAASFADGQERRRLLRSFHARGLFHPLYALFALEDSLIDQEEAFAYFTAEIEKTGEIEKTLFEVFFSRIEDEAVVARAKKYLNSFSHTIFEDNDNDGIANMRVRYERGRPVFAEYDKDQDGMAELQVRCDYGTPKEAVVNRQESASFVHLVYGSYPYVKTASMNGMSFEFPSEKFAWYPLDLYVSPALFDASVGTNFYIGQKNNTADFLSERIFFSLASRVTTPISESVSGKKDAKAVFSVLRGRPVRAEYFSGDVLYAAASFENGIIKNRTLDTGGNGIFDVTEEFGFSLENAQKYFNSQSEKNFFYAALFGKINTAQGVFLSKIARDTDGDKINDYMEEFSLDADSRIVKTCYWDNDADGNWDCGFSETAGSTTEAFFRTYEIGSSKAVITRIFSKNGVPSRVVSEKGEYAVTFDNENNFYWLGRQSGEPSDSAALVNAFSGELAFQYGCAIITSSAGTKLMARHIAQYNFGEVLE